MVCSDPFEEVVHVIPENGVTRECEESFIDGIRKGLEDFAKGNYIVFEDDDELEAYMMSL
ncbi:MAG: hypothetical protein PHQ39_11050 [Methanothrix soehngenii]|nr:hypothetical protein [Methanothrix soehngenii]